MGHEEVLLYFVVIRNRRWPPLSLIGRDIFDNFSRNTAFGITGLARNVPLGF
jgi:hypothetical protein